MSEQTVTVERPQATISASNSPEFFFGVRQSRDVTITLDFFNGKDSVDVEAIFHGRSHSQAGWVPLPLITRLKVTSDSDSHLAHFDRKFDSIKVTFVRASGEIDVKASAILE